MSMELILEVCSALPLRKCDAGQVIISEGDSTGRMYVLFQGAVEVIKDDIAVANISEAGAIFGEMSALLGTPHTATVKTTQPSTFCVIEDAKATLHKSPDLCIHVCELLARRLDAVNRYLVDVRHQFEGHDHIGMIDRVIDTLMNRQPRERLRPPESTIAKTESPH